VNGAQAPVSQEAVPVDVKRHGKPSAFRRAAARCSGTIVSLAVHGGLAVLAIWSVTGPRTGRGGGTVGTSEVASGPSGFSALVHQDRAPDFEFRHPDTREFPEPPAEEASELAEVVPVPSQDFLKEPPETGTPVPKAAPPSDEPARTRSREAYSKLPPNAGVHESEAPVPKSGGEQKGNSTANGTGGETGGAGDGTVGALFMPAPDYPPSARRKGIEGVVVVLIDVQPDGHCENARLAESSGNDALDDAALSAIRKWRYDPRSNNAPEIRRVRFVFKLTR